MIKNLFIAILFTCSSVGVLAQSREWLQMQSADFEIDTANIEQEMRNMINQNYSTVGMIDAANYCEEAYYTLLNKYYELAMTVFTKENQQLLKDSQLKWMALRDADKDLVDGLIDQARNEAGGGTVWGVIGANERADITRRRVIEIYNYIMLPKLN